MTQPLVEPSRTTALPGLRAFGTPGFRVVLATVLIVTATLLLGSLLLARAASPTGQFGIDATDYLTAADRIARGESPYARSMLDGPVDSQGIDRYRYPPPLAQLLVPLASTPTPVALWAWFAIGLGAIVASLLVALRMAGLLRLEPVLWSLAAACLFLPVFDSLWKGNVSGLLALLVAVAAGGGAAGGAAVALAALLKVVPVVFVPGWLLVGSRSRRAMIATAIAVVGASVLLSPGAWRDYLTVLPNMLAGSADEATNVAPWSMVARSGAPEQLGTFVRAGSIALALGAVAASVVVIRRQGGVALAATLCSIAMLLLPAALWYHYLVVLLPLAIIAWPQATHGARAAIVVAGLCVSGGIAWLPLATIGWVAMAGAILLAMRPAAGTLREPVAA
jgi:alpha-1,2-mannosyltransferase